MTTKSEGERNPIFDELAADSKDIEGLVAYALYKRHKRTWASGFRERNQREPTPSEELDFAHSAGTPDQLDRYRKDAQDQLIAFGTGLIEQERPNIVAAALADRAGTVLSKMEGTASWKNIIITSIAATLVTTYFCRCWPSESGPLDSTLLMRWR